MIGAEAAMLMGCVCSGWFNVKGSEGEEGVVGGDT
jgi:hypothetical protein